MNFILLNVLNSNLNSLSNNFKILLEIDNGTTNNFSIIKLGKTVRLAGTITLEVAVPAWDWVIDFRSLSSEYKPSQKIYFTDLTSARGFELHPAGYIQTTMEIAPATYYLDICWLI